MLRRVKDID